MLTSLGRGLRSLALALSVSALGATTAVGQSSGSAAGGSGSPASEVCGAVEIAVFAWPTAEIAAALLQRLLEDGHGCEAALISAEPGRALATMRGAAADAPPLIVTALSRARIERDFETTGEASPTRIGAALFEARERVGLFVPAWFAAAHRDIRSLRDAIAAPERFITPPRTRPELWLCPANWTCAAESRAAARVLGADERFDLVTPASGDALIAAATAAARDRRPWIGYLWTPSMATAQQPMVRLEIGDVRLCGGDGRCRPPFASSPLVTAYEARFAERAPRAAALLSRFAIPIERMREALALRRDAGASARQAADALLASAPELLGGWLDPAAQARFTQAAADRASSASKR